MLEQTFSKRKVAEDFVNALYVGLLSREPEPGAAQAFVEEILAGRSLAALLEDFLNSPERMRKCGLYVPSGHYYSPIVNKQEAEWHLLKMASDPLPHVHGIRIDSDRMLETWKELLPYLRDLHDPASVFGKHRYRFDNGSYSWGDGSILSALIRQRKPKRLIEIGSGWSSACTMDTINLYLEGECDVTLIEPYPDLAREVLGSMLKFKLIAEPVQRVSLDVFEDLDRGDILFIDSTHVLRTGSDVCFELFEILPRLKSGVLVHFHDVFWPFEYPSDWILNDNRSWNELYGIRAFLTDNNSWEIVFFNDFFAKAHTAVVQDTCPPFLKNSGGALWIEKN